MKYTKIYCGSNNKTKELELGIIKDVMKLSNGGYTLIEGYGVYKDGSESVAIIEIYVDYNTGIIQELKKQLEQNSLLVVESIADVKYCND